MMGSVHFAARQGRDVATRSSRTSGPVPAPRAHYAYAIVACCIVMMGVPCALVLNCAGIFFEPVSATLGVSLSSFSSYYAVLNLAMMLMLPVGGRLLDVLDVRVVFSACVAVDGACYLAMSRFDAIWQFYVAGALLGVATAPMIYLAVPKLIDAWFVRRAGFFTGLCMAFTGLGGVLLNPLGTALIDSGPEGWRTAYVVFGALMLAVGLPFTALVLRGDPAEKGLLPYGAGEAGEASAARADCVVTAGKCLAEGSRPLSVARLVLFCLFVSVNQTVYQFLSSYCSSLSGSLPQVAGLTGAIASACMAGQAVSKLILGAVNDRSVAAGTVLGLGAGIAGALLMAIVPGRPALLLAGAALFGSACACTTVQTPLLVRATFGPRDYTAIYARVSMVGAFGCVVAAVLWGKIVERPGGYLLMFALSVACMVACVSLGLLALGRAHEGARDVR